MDLHDTKAHNPTYKNIAKRIRHDPTPRIIRTPPLMPKCHLRNTFCLVFASDRPGSAGEAYTPRMCAQSERADIYPYSNNK
eukprot:8456543-Pyramimonas_sp.AAC.1